MSWLVTLTAKSGAALALLHRRAAHRAEGAKHTTIAWFGLEPGTTRLANIEELAGIGRHRFDRSMTALRTGDRGL
jgi:hypothetical protein